MLDFVDGNRYGRGRALALAIVAAAFVLLGRICIAADDHAAGHHAEQAVCCVMIDEASAASVPHEPAFKPALLVVGRVALRLAPPPAGRSTAVRPPGAPGSKVLAYHVRSARILS